MSNRYQAAILSASFNGLKAPDAPTIGTATAGAGSASVTFTAPANVGGGAITGYTAISSPGSILGTGSSSPITVSGLTNGTAYTFTVVATNAYGTGPASAASNSVTPAVNYIEEVFSTYLYTGNGATQTITNGIDLSGSGGLTWIRRRGSATDHHLEDTVRGATKYLISNLNYAEQTNANAITAFNSTGFSLGSYADVNSNTGSFVSWTFREQPKFFDIVTWSGDSTSGRQIAHSLGSTPGMVIIKSLAADNWCVWHRSLTAGRYIVLNSTAAQTTSGAVNRYGNGTTTVDPTSTYITVGSNGEVNQTGNNYVAYLFAHDAGGFGLTGTDNVISCGTFMTDGSGNATVTLGYEAQWVLIKSVGSGSWYMVDIMRGLVTGGNDSRLQADQSDAEYNLQNLLAATATGFNAEGEFFATSQAFIYIAIRRGPMAVPTVGTSVFFPFAGNDASITTGFPVDMAFDNSRTGFVSYNTLNISRLMGINILRTSSTVGESPDLSNWWDSNTKYYPAALGANTVSYAYQRAPGFMDVVCYTGDGGYVSRNHNLAAVPEMMIVKARSTTSNWSVYHSALGFENYVRLNTTAASAGTGDFWYLTPTATQFSTGGYVDINDTGVTYVNYLFATCAGVSKVGSYTGTGALLTVNCGFTTGARFILIKRSDSTGDWYVWDSARGITAGNDPYLFLNTATAEVTGTNYVDTTGVGFQVTAAAPAGLNAVGGTYIFLAIA